MRQFGVLALALVVSACASVTYAPAPASPADMAAAQRAQQLAAIDNQMARRARLYDLAFPLRAANTNLCAEVKPGLGIVLADRRDYGDLVGGIRTEDLARLRVAEGVFIRHVAAGSPAARAGLRAGDRVDAVGDVQVAKSARTKAATAPISKALKAEEPVSLTLYRAGAVRQVTVEGVDLCDVSIKMSTDDALNARAIFNGIVIDAGLMRVADDGMVQFVIAHELAHTSLRHSRKIVRNNLVTGSVVYGPVLGLGGQVLDRIIALTPADHKDSYAGKAQFLAEPWRVPFEAEADYLGLYMLARVDGDLGAARRLFDLFAREKPKGTWMRYTHPAFPERVTAAALARAEIEAKRVAGEPLVPERE